VKIGTEVSLRFDAYPYQKFGQFKGLVREISLNTIPIGELLPSSNSSMTPLGKAVVNASEPVYRIRVQLASQQLVAFNKTHSLKPGMQLTASLVLEHRSIAEWVLAPLYGVITQQ
jgi:membrane fusion protein